jgi:hypothetical protein
VVWAATVEVIGPPKNPTETKRAVIKNIKRNRCESRLILVLPPF